ncbi:alpha-elapitoxin-Oh2b-like [Sebastes umbrosus]|uniref:alpha-elapitoxin-Oh2b-like n=1 Tax=Sebastes umbrosus TaxID=72105 RepID=UPI00189C9BD0|nr:alpha-elapitoxin-Oh2b-like [Sebastes umbrosus]
MARIVIAIIAVVASFMLAESLTCNKCSYGLLGYCLSSSEESCTTNTSVCFTGKATFPAISSAGFNTQGCREPAGCNATTNGTLVGLAFETKIDCCSTDNCNPVVISGAPSTKMTFTAAIGVAVLASMWGSIL